MAYVTYFLVEGPAGQFPPDMLRYDQCWPSNSQDAVNISECLRCLIRDDLSLPAQSIELTHIQQLKGWKPTDGRWNSFGWVVKRVTERKV